ncbi:hypothetical protein ACS0TY_023386 [Phlomoides rotata]
MTLGSMGNAPFNLEVLSTFRFTSRPPRVPTIKKIRWQHPLIHHMKINVDSGASGAPGILTGGGVFRDSFSIFRGCFAMTHGRDFVFKAELDTDFHALEIVINICWKNIWMECYSLYVVQIFRSKNPEVPWRLLA